MELGDNSQKRLGLGSNVSGLIPVSVSGIEHVREISAGGFHSVAMKRMEASGHGALTPEDKLGMGHTIIRGIFLPCRRPCWIPRPRIQGAGS